MIYVDLIECVGKDLEHELQKLVKKERGYCEIISVAPSLLNNTPGIRSVESFSFVTGWAVVWRDTNTQKSKWQGGMR